MSPARTAAVANAPILMAIILILMLIPVLPPPVALVMMTRVMQSKPCSRKPKVQHCILTWCETL
jgi:hypothetical protein